MPVSGDVITAVCGDVTTALCGDVTDMSTANLLVIELAAIVDVFILGVHERLHHVVMINCGVMIYEYRYDI